MMPYPISEYWEGNVPIKILEYMAMEKVVLCTNLVAFRTITRGASCAHIIPDNSPERIAAALESLYLQRARLPQWGQAGREIVKTGYTWQAIASDISAFLRRTAATRASLAAVQR
jgi:glycosyltransferase involved in cell wall biosynthesis